MVGASCSMAMEKRSSVSRPPRRSSELQEHRQRSQANARRIRSSQIQSSVGVRLRVAADQADEQLLERLRPGRAPAQVGDRRPARRACP